MIPLIVKMTKSLKSKLILGVFWNEDPNRNERTIPRWEFQYEQLPRNISKEEYFKIKCDLLVRKPDEIESEKKYEPLKA